MRLTSPESKENCRLNHTSYIQDLVDNANDLIQSLDEEGRFCYVNNKWKEVLGYSDEEIIGLGFQDIVHPDYISQFSEIFSKLKAGESVDNFEAVFLTKDGREVFVDGNLRVIKNGSGIFTMGIFRDITRRKNAEKKLKEYEKKLQYIIDNSWDIIFNTDFEGNITFINKAAERITGYSTEELLKMNINDLVAPEYIAIVSERLEKRIKGEPVEQPFDFEIVHKNGRIITVELTTSPMYLNGKLIGVQGVARDITEKKKAEKELEIQRNQLLSIFDGIDEPIYVVDPETYEVLYANEALKKEFGEVIGKKCYVMFQGLESPCPFCTNDIIFGEENKGSHIWEFQNRINKKWYRCIDKAIRWPDGRKVRYELAIDITDRKKAEDSMKIYMCELESENEHLQQELNNLLNRVEYSREKVISTAVIDEFGSFGGGIYLVPVEYIEKARNLFVEALDAGIPTLAIVRTSPRRFRQILGRSAEMVWLTTNRMNGIVCIDPNDVVALSLVISEFFKKAPEGIVLFEGLEFLLANVEFSRVLRLIQILNDRVSVVDGAILLVADLNVLNDRELRLIERECMEFSELSANPRNGILKVDSKV